MQRRTDPGYSCNGITMTRTQANAYGEQKKEPTYSPHTKDENGDKIEPIVVNRMTVETLVERLHDVENDFECQFGSEMFDELLISVDKKTGTLVFEHKHSETPQDFLKRYKTSDMDVISYMSVTDIDIEDRDMLITFEYGEFLIRYKNIVPTELSLWSTHKSILLMQSFFDERIKNRYSFERIK
ncbi:MAG: hypothetical protein ACP5N7_00870 [Candidatus Pacearchaeota archaeon]